MHLKHPNCKKKEKEKKRLVITYRMCCQLQILKTEVRKLIEVALQRSKSFFKKQKDGCNKSQSGGKGTRANNQASMS